jgi:hypothetical protein
LPGANHCVVAHHAAVDFGLAAGVDIEAVGKAAADFAHRHIARRQRFGMHAVANRHRPTDVGKVIQAAWSLIEATFWLLKKLFDMGSSVKLLNPGANGDGNFRIGVSNQTRRRVGSG